MGVSKNSGTPKWMVDNGKPYEQMDDLGGKLPIFGNTHVEKLLEKSSESCSCLVQAMDPEKISVSKSGGNTNPGRKPNTFSPLFAGVRNIFQDNFFGYLRDAKRQ